jgi:hypothetical protein
MKKTAGKKKRKSLNIGKIKRYVKYVKCAIKALDAQMELPSSVERGKNIADILNNLEITTDMIQRYELE